MRRERRVWKEGMKIMYHVSLFNNERCSWSEQERACDSTGSFNLLNRCLYFIIDLSSSARICLVNRRLLKIKVIRPLFAAHLNVNELLALQQRGRYWQIDWISDNKKWFSCNSARYLSSHMNSHRDYRELECLKFHFAERNGGKNCKTWRFMIIFNSLNCIIMRKKSMKARRKRQNRI